jgi:hypothetical protein
VLYLTADRTLHNRSCKNYKSLIYITVVSKLFEFCFVFGVFIGTNRHILEITVRDFSLFPFQNVRRANSSYQEMFALSQKMETIHHLTQDTMQIYKAVAVAFS